MRVSYAAIRPDVRAFEDSDDMFGHCRKCGRNIIVLPEDRRFGFCFDCLDFLNISKRSENGDGRAFFMNHENGFHIQ
ncbi:MAG: hypothetical protein PHU53_02565 [Thermoplasmata archaeon]|nr:hypothetical protein [Thermoplasmata archaeon]